MPWREEAILVERDANNPWRWAKFLGRMTGSVSFIGELYWRFDYNGTYGHAVDDQAAEEMREIDLREARLVGLC